MVRRAESNATRARMTIYFYFFLMIKMYSLLFYPCNNFMRFRNDRITAIYDCISVITINIYTYLVFN
jgi:hypothetical protein